MSQITPNEYMKEIQELAESIVKGALADNDNDKAAALEEISDTRLHETIDGHQWIIYNAYNLDVIRHSDNSDYYIDNFGNEEAGEVLKRNGLDGLHTAIAYYAMYADTQELISDEMDKQTEETDSEEGLA